MKKAVSLKKIDKIDRPLANLTKKGGKKPKSVKSEKHKGR
jgi:hypothetical protein